MKRKPAKRPVKYPVIVNSSISAETSEKIIRLTHELILSESAFIRYAIEDYIRLQEGRRRVRTKPKPIPLEKRTAKCGDQVCVQGNPVVGTIVGFEAHADLDGNFHNTYILEDATKHRTTMSGLFADQLVKSLVRVSDAEN